jgi:hypothetical protein
MLTTALADDISAKILNWYAHRDLSDVHLYEIIVLNRPARMRPSRAWPDIAGKKIC